MQRSTYRKNIQVLKLRKIFPYTNSGNFNVANLLQPCSPRDIGLVQNSKPSLRPSPEDFGTRGATARPRAWAAPGRHQRAKSMRGLRNVAGRFHERLSCQRDAELYQHPLASIDNTLCTTRSRPSASQPKVQAKGATTSKSETACLPGLKHRKQYQHHPMWSPRPRAVRKPCSFTIVLLEGAWLEASARPRGHPRGPG